MPADPFARSTISSQSNLLAAQFSRSAVLPLLREPKGSQKGGKGGPKGVFFGFGPNLSIELGASKRATSECENALDLAPQGFWEMGSNMVPIYLKLPNRRIGTIPRRGGAQGGGGRGR